MIGLLARHTTLTRTAPGVYERTTDGTWEGHQSLFGGYALALAVAALEDEVAATTGLGDPLRSARSVTMHFLRPFLPGPFRAEVARTRSA